MLKTILAVSTACSILLLAATEAQARGTRHHGTREFISRSMFRVNAHHAYIARRGHRMAFRAIRGASQGGYASIAVEYTQPSDCHGIAWCGCWLRHTLGIADSSLNLAINWAHVGSSASPESANVVVWRHHVGKLLTYEKGRILIQSGNDRGAVRTRWVSPHILGGVVAYRKV